MTVALPRKRKCECVLTLSLSPFALALWEDDSDYSRLLKQAEDLAGGLPDGLKYSPENLRLQYGDWFDRYPHGVSSSDFLDPAGVKKKESGDDAVLEQKPETYTVAP